jgi:replicative DNA helicase
MNDQDPEDLEKGIIGCILLGGADILTKISEHCMSRGVMVDEVLYWPKYRSAFLAFRMMCENGVAIDLITAASAIMASPEQDKLTIAELSGCQDHVPGTSGWSYYVDYVIDLYALRVAKNDLQAAYMEIKDTKSLNAISGSLRIKTFKRSEDPDIRSLVISNADEVEDRFSPNSTRVWTGIRSVDKILRGIGKEFVVVAARPSMGKSSFGATLAMNVSRSMPRRAVGFISLEMDSVEITGRFVEIESRLSMNQYDQFDENDHRVLARARTAVSRLPILIHNGRGMTIGACANKIRSWHAENMMSCIIVDYVQKLKSDRDRDDEYQRISLASGVLCDMAAEIGVPVIALAQLNRDAEGDRPMLKHLKGSGALEQDAHVVLLLNPKGDDRVHRPIVDAEVIVEKRRGGSTGVADVRFHRYCGLWDDPLLPDEQ